MSGTMVADLFAKLGLRVDRKSWDVGHELVHGMHEMLVEFLAFEGIKKLGEFAMGTVELGRHLDVMSQKTGLGVEALQEYGFAAKLSDTDLEAFGQSIVKLDRAMGHAARTGQGPAVDSLKELGIQFNSPAFTKLSLDDKIMEIADRLSDVKDPAKKAAIAMDLFGRAGANMIPIFNNGKDGLKELRAEYKKFELSKGQVQALDEFGKSAEATKAKLLALKDQAVAAIIPKLLEIAEAVSEWISDNRELISQGFDLVVGAIATAFGVLRDVISLVVEGIGFFVDNSWLGIAALAALGTAMTVFAAKAVAAWIVGLGPVGLVIVAITAVVAAIGLLRKHWDAIGGAFAGVGRTIVGALRGLWSAFSDIGSRIKKFFVEDIPNAIIGAFRTMWEGVKAGASAAWDAIKDLPVFKQLVWLSSKFGGGGGSSASAGSPAGEPVAMNTPSAPASGGNGPVAIRGGDIHVEVNAPGGDPNAIAAVVQQKITEHMDTWMLETKEVVG